ncbi:MAG: ATP-binding protein [Litoreibacter sp.]|nr:ATP-binding protein [Litoreibacter sp.]
MFRNLGLLLVISLLGAVALFWTSYNYFKGQELTKAAARLTLYRSTVETELRHFAHLPFLLSLDPIVVGALQGGDPRILDKRLARISQSAGLDAIYLMDPNGLTISASNARSPDSFVGQNYGFRPYFQAAKRGELGEFYGIGATTGIPGYFYAISVKPGAAQEKGVIAIKLDLSELQESWQASGERMILSNSDGVVLLASNPDWRYRSLEQLSEAQRARILETRQFGSEQLKPLDWSRDEVQQTALIGEERFLYLQTADLPNSWSLHFFVPDDQAVTRAGLTTGAFMLLLMSSFIAWQVARERRIGAALERSEIEENRLRVANTKLAKKINVRRAAEKTLQKTQADLERAGRLAALGQLASSVTHELGQPITAMRNQLTAAEMTQGPSQLNDKMQGLVARMEGITRQLKFFSRKGHDKLEPAHMSGIIESALELLEPTIAQMEATVDFAPSEQPLMIRANKLRMEQVVTNIVRNALHAIEQSDVKRVEITAGENDTEVWFEVADTGHGLEDKSLEDLSEPFATTRESGEGMGLGLTISAGIVADHDGTIAARNREAGGAVFRVVLPRFIEGAAA